MTSPEPGPLETTAALPAVPAFPAVPAPLAVTTSTLEEPAALGSLPPLMPETTEIGCPSCGTVSYFSELGRDAGGFCRECDFPLFWARAPRPEAGDATGGDSGLRRLPGTAGRVALATIDCPVCTEPNPVAATICIRCGSELRPVPVVVLPEPEPVVLPEPEPLPEPPPPRVIWPWIVLCVLAVIGVVALILALTW